mmetsp:Transcript_12545/g.34566  ORF Transcript_12545/g.34566 Transcript_12545/m.34566 type:complete len:206 (-) Transcript_12545:306-923(-)
MRERRRRSNRVVYIDLLLFLSNMRRKPLFRTSGGGSNDAFRARLASRSAFIFTATSGMHIPSSFPSFLAFFRLLYVSSWLMAEMISSSNTPSVFCLCCSSMTAWITSMVVFFLRKSCSGDLASSPLGSNSSPSIPRIASFIARWSLCWLSASSAFVYHSRALCSSGRSFVDSISRHWFLSSSNTTFFPMLALSDCVVTVLRCIGC